MKRRQKRVRAALPVRTWFSAEDGKPILHAACTLDVTPTGARLTGMRAQTETGAILTVERGRSKARFRIIWVGGIGTPSEGHLGIECLDAGKWNWDVQLPAGSAEDGDFEPVRLDEDERRKPPPRYSCKGTVDLRRDAANADPMSGHLRDINQLGCFVRVSPPPSLNTHLRLVLVTVEGVRVRARGVVHRVDGASGVFIQFTEIHRQDKPALEHLIARLSGSESVPASTV